MDVFDDSGHIRPLDELCNDIMEIALVRYDGSPAIAARHLQIGRSTLYRHVLWRRGSGRPRDAQEEGVPCV